MTYIGRSLLSSLANDIVVYINSNVNKLNNEINNIYNEQEISADQNKDQREEGRGNNRKRSRSEEDKEDKEDEGVEDNKVDAMDIEEEEYRAEELKKDSLEAEIQAKLMQIDEYNIHLRVLNNFKALNEYTMLDLQEFNNIYPIYVIRMNEELNEIRENRRIRNGDVNEEEEGNVEVYDTNNEFLNRFINSLRGIIRLNNGMEDDGFEDRVPTKLDNKYLNKIPIRQLECDVKDKCAICFDDLKEGFKVRDMPCCKYSLHCQCIERWLSEHKKCPTCAMNLEDYFTDKIQPKVK